MRLSLFATAALLAFLVSAPSVEARPYHGYKSHRIEHTHANWTGRRHYSSRQYSQRRYTGRHNNRYAYRHHSYRKYAYRQQRVHQRYAQHRSYGHRRYASASVGGRPAPGAAGGCGPNAAVVQNTTLLPTGGTMAGPVVRKSAPWSSGRITSA